MGRFWGEPFLLPPGGRGWECRKRTLTSWRMPCDLAKQHIKTKKTKINSTGFCLEVKDIYPFVTGVFSLETKIRIDESTDVYEWIYENMHRTAWIWGFWIRLEKLPALPFQSFETNETISYIYICIFIELLTQNLFILAIHCLFENHLCTRWALVFYWPVMWGSGVANELKVM